MSIPKTSAWNWKIYLGSNLIAEGGCGWWQPWSNTLLYLPLNEDLLDHSWNNVNVNNSWVTLNTSLLQGRWCAYNSGSWYLTWTLNIQPSTTITLSCWAYDVSFPYHWTNYVTVGTDSTGKWRIIWVAYPGRYYAMSALDWNLLSSTIATTWIRFNLIGVFNNGNFNLYKNWTKIATWAEGFTTPWTGFEIFRGLNLSDKPNCYLSEVIAENKWWSEDFAINYYNQTKSKYWL